MDHSETVRKAPEQVVQVGQAAQLPMATQVELFDPPLCCPTGLCGPTLDQTLLDVSETVQALKEAGIGVERYQMASHPHIFLKHPEVMKLVRERGMAAFPMTVVAGQIVKIGAYLTRHEMEQALLDAKGAEGASR
ncbi:MAG: arsenite efflux transporter metallochaperone ArsD [Chloroflexota bacterium]